MSMTATYRKTRDPKIRLWRNTKTALVYAVLIGLSCVFLIPFFWMLSTSLTEAGKVIMRNRPWIPNPMVWANYKQALTVLPFHLFLKNTLTITLSCIVGQTLSASLVAFGFSRMRFPGRDVLFIMVLSTMMLPAQVTMIPTFILFTKLRWIDTLKPLIVPAFFGDAFTIFLLRQFFLTIPDELSDAARVDGASEFQIMTRVIVPLAKPAIAAVALFSFLYNWNDFFGPLLYIGNNSKLWTLSLGLSEFRTMHHVEWNLTMAASLLFMLPVIILFFLAQRVFVEGVTLTGVKG